MAKRRMFSLDIIDTDEFIEMPVSARELYFQLGMRADDDGFVASPKKIMRAINASDDDLKVLFTKKFIIGFETGIIVIRHWKIHNYIQSDRYHETIYLNEKEQLFITENNMYTDCIQNGDSGKVRLVKARKGKGKNKKKKETQERFIIPPTLEMVTRYCKERNNNISPQKFIDSNEAKGWVVGKLRTPMKDWQATIRTWEGNNNENKSESSVGAIPKGIKRKTDEHMDNV